MLSGVRDDQLHEYIVEKDFGKRLSAAEIQRLAQAFLGLAHMDREFAPPSPRGANRAHPLPAANLSLRQPHKPPLWAWRPAQASPLRIRFVRGGFDHLIKL